MFSGYDTVFYFIVDLSLSLITGDLFCLISGKSEVINFLQRHHMECSHVQIRTKIMNELRRARMKAKRTSRIANAQARLVQRDEGGCGSLSEQDASNLPNG
jgi:hypothetical protein